VSVSKQRLMELAERKLGTGAVIRITLSGWIAENTIDGKRTRVTAKTRNMLEWSLNGMPDLKREERVSR